MLNNLITPKNVKKHGNTVPIHKTVYQSTREITEFTNMSLCQINRMQHVLTES